MNYETSDHLTKQQQRDMGSFYTPESLSLEIAELIKEGIPDNYDPNFHILDPSVGKGNLFVAILKKYPQVHNDNLYGIDIDKEAIKFCLEKFPGGHFQVGDALNDDFTDENFWTKKWDEKYNPKRKNLI